MFDFEFDQSSHTKLGILQLPTDVPNQKNCMAITGHLYGPASHVNARWLPCNFFDWVVYKI